MIPEKSKEYKGTIVINCGRGVGKSHVKSLWYALNTYIKDGVCTNNGSIPCDIGYTCDVCPFNKPKKQSDKEVVIFT